MSERVKTFAIAGNVRGTRKLKKMTASIYISKRVLQLKVVNDIVHGRRKRHEKLACFSFIGLQVHKEMAIGYLIIGASTCFSGVGVLLFVRGDVVCEYLGISHLGREEGLNCVLKCRRSL